MRRAAWWGTAATVIVCAVLAPFAAASIPPSPFGPFGGSTVFGTGTATWQATDVQATGTCAEEGCYYSFTFGPANLTGFWRYNGLNYVGHVGTGSAPGVEVEGPDGGVYQVSPFSIAGTLRLAKDPATAHYLTGSCQVSSYRFQNTVLNQANAASTDGEIDAPFGLDCYASVDGGPDNHTIVGLDGQTHTATTNRTDYEQWPTTA